VLNGTGNGGGRAEALNGKKSAREGSVNLIMNA